MHINPMFLTGRDPQVLAPGDSTTRRSTSSRPRTSSTSRTTTSSVSRSSSSRTSTSRTLSAQSSSSSEAPTTSSTSATSTSPRSVSPGVGTPSTSSSSTSSLLSSRSSTAFSSRTSTASTRSTSSSSTGAASGEFATSQKPFNAAFLALLALLIFIVLGGILYARRLARAKESSGVSPGPSSRHGRGGNHEKVPLTRVPSLQYENEGDTGSAEQQPANLWNKATSIARARTPSLAGIGGSRFRGQEYSPERDVERDTNLPAEPTTPTRGTSTVTRMFTGVKEPKSPKADRFSSGISGQASSVEGGRRRYGELAGSVSAETLDHLMSIANAKIPGQASKGPEPLRKRHVNKAAVGTPIVTTPIIPGEMARLVTPELIPVEEARARAAGSSTRLPMLDPALDVGVRLPVGHPSLDGGDNDEDKRQSSREPLPVIDEASEAEDERSVSPTSQRSKVSRPASEARRRTPSEGRRDSEESGQQGNPFPWAPTPPRIKTPLVNELRSNLLSARPALLSSTSQEMVSRELDVAVPEAYEPKRPKMRRRSLTEPDDDRIAQAEMGQTDLSPWNLKGFPLPPRESSSTTEGGFVPRYSSGSSWDASSGSSGKNPPMGSFASRGSDMMWSGYNVDPPQGNLPPKAVDPASREGTPGQPGIREADAEEADEAMELATIEYKQFSPRRISIAPPQVGHTHPRSSVWSMASQYSTDEEGRELAAGPKYLTMEPVAPLRLSPRLSPDPGPRLPTPPLAQLRRASADSTRKQSTSSSNITGYFDPRVAASGLVASMPSNAAPPIKIDFVASPGKPAKSVKIDFAASPETQAKSPTRTTPPLVEPLATSRRASSPRKPTSPMLEDLQSSRNLFRGRTAATPPAHSPIAKPRLRFSDDVEVMKSPVPSPAPTSSRVLTPATVPSVPSSRSRTPIDIISPQPVPRRGSIVVPSPSPVHSNLESPDNRSHSSADQITDPPSQESQPRQVDPLRQSTGSIYENWQPRELDPPRQSIESVPEEWKPRDLDAPKAVQTRDFWRELRRTSVTGYFVQAAQEEGDSGQNDGEGEDSLR